jgi:V-type H+-transporting ATPase subunit H
MSLDGPTYLASLQNNIRHRPIPWDGAVRAGSLTEDQLAKIRAVDKAKRPEQRKEIVSADLDGYRLLFVGGNGSPSVLEKAGKNTSLVQYILVLLADLLDGKSGLLTCIPTSKHQIVFQHPTSGTSPAIQVLCAAARKISFSSLNYTALFSTSSISIYC